MHSYTPDVSIPAETHGAFRRALAEAADALAALPRSRAGVAAARERVARLAAAHPAVRLELAVDLPPASDDADYDLLIGHPGGGTVALGYRPDRGNPWFVDYAEHWAANYVLTVGGLPVTVQQALTALEVAGEGSPGLVDSLVEDALAARAMGVDPPEVTPDEAQAAVDAFRAARGLHSAAATHAWLARLGWSVELFQSLIENGVRARKLRERVTAAEVEPHFHAHRGDFDLVRVFRAETASAEDARRLAALAAVDGLLAAAGRADGVSGGGVAGTLATARAHELPPELAGAPVGRVVGPMAARGRHWVGEVLGRSEATLDAATRAAVRDVLFRRWLDARRAEHAVRWHWL
ncbi:MAG TPA: TIGR04500 family putative peptide maturation system protein [Gemmatimonadaceae bacterium]|nr:TIGR04500 family putative peptide maturation system protein [Gemmatimonadaceae bacterium]